MDKFYEVIKFTLKIVHIQSAEKLINISFVKIYHKMIIKVAITV